MNNGFPPNYVSAARAMRRVTQRDLANLTGLTQVGISHIETSRRSRNPHASSKRVIALALDYSVDELFPPAGKPSSSFELRQWAKALEGKAGR